MADRGVRRWAAVAVAAAALSASAACGGDDDDRAAVDDGEVACAAADGGRVTVVAEDLAWDVACAELPADEPVTIVVDNRDEGVNHNLHVTDAPGGPTTELEAGPVVQELPVQLATGTYRFVCDIHPTMVGELRVLEQPGAPTTATP